MSFFLEKMTFLLSKEPLFASCAFVASFLFIVQFLSHIFGAVEDIDTSDPDSGNFKWFSKQTLTGFLMVFGWVGLTCKNEFETSGAIAILFALGGGVAAFIMTGLLFKTARNLHSSGAVFRIEDSIGKEAIVYQRISNEQIGKISLVLNDVSYEIDAISQSGELPSFSRVEIVKKLDEKTVIVKNKLST